MTLVPVLLAPELVLVPDGHDRICVRLFEEGERTCRGERFKLDRLGLYRLVNGDTERSPDGERVGLSSIGSSRDSGPSHVSTFSHRSMGMEQRVSPWDGLRSSLQTQSTPASNACKERLHQPRQARKAADAAST